jgi:hypothetical protein
MSVVNAGISGAITRPICANLFRVFFVKVPQNRHPACPGLPWERSVVERPALSFYPSDLTAPIKVTALPFVIPSAAEGSAVRPGSRTKFSIPLVLPQNRHPERSASQIYRLTEGFWRGVEGPRRCSFHPCRSELFDHRRPTTSVRRYALDRHGQITVIIFRPQLCARSCGLGGLKTPSSMGERSTAEVLRLRARNPPLSDRSVRRFAQSL